MEAEAGAPEGLGGGEDGLSCIRSAIVVIRLGLLRLLWLGSGERRVWRARAVAVDCHGDDVHRRPLRHRRGRAAACSSRRPRSVAAAVGVLCKKHIAAASVALHPPRGDHCHPIRDRQPVLITAGSGGYDNLRLSCERGCVGMASAAEGALQALRLFDRKAGGGNDKRLLWGDERVAGGDGCGEGVADWRGGGGAVLVGRKQRTAAVGAAACRLRLRSDSAARGECRRERANGRRGSKV